MTDYVLLCPSTLRVEPDAAKNIGTKDKPVTSVMPLGTIDALAKDAEDDRRPERQALAKDVFEEYKNIREHDRAEGDFGEVFVLGEGKTFTTLGSQFSHIDRQMVSCDRFDPHRNILQTAEFLKSKGKSVKILTLENALLARADSMGVKADLWTVKHPDQFYKGWVIATGGDTLVEIFKNKGRISRSDCPQLFDDLSPNEYVIFEEYDQKGKQLVVRFDAKRDELVHLIGDHPTKETASDYIGIKAKNIRQRMAIDAAFNPDIKICYFMGPAGCGKTHISLDAAIRTSAIYSFHISGDNGLKGLPSYEELMLTPIHDLTKSQQEILKANLLYHRKVILTRPMIADEFELDLGALPGSKEEKIMPWLGPFSDQIQRIMHRYNFDKAEFVHLATNEAIEILPYLHVQGRSLEDSIWGVDEAEEFVSKQIYKMVTRIADNARIVFTGEPLENNRNLKLESTGLYRWSASMKESEMTATVVFTESDVERSKATKEVLKYSPSFDYKEFNKARILQL